MTNFNPTCLRVRGKRPGVQWEHANKRQGGPQEENSVESEGKRFDFQYNELEVTESLLEERGVSSKQVELRRLSGQLCTLWVKPKVGHPYLTIVPLRQRGFR